MERLAILALIETRPGMEQELAEFLRSSALPVAQADPQSVRCYALKLGTYSLGIFDRFADPTGRDALFCADIAIALFTRPNEPHASPPVVGLSELLASSAMVS